MSLADKEAPFIVKHRGIPLYITNLQKNTQKLKRKLKEFMKKVMRKSLKMKIILLLTIIIPAWRPRLARMMGTQT